MMLKKYTDVTIANSDDHLKELAKVSEESVGYEMKNTKWDCCVLLLRLWSQKHIVTTISMTIPRVYYDEERAPLLIQEKRPHMQFGYRAEVIIW